MQGFILLHRKMLDESWITKPNVVHLAIHLLLNANHKPKKIIFNNMEMTITRGQILTGREKMSTKTGLTEQKLRTSLKILKNTGFLTIKSTNKFSIITICKYDYYQTLSGFTNQQTNQPITNQQPTNNQQITTNKECIKNITFKNKFKDYVFLTQEEEEKLRKFYNVNFDLAIEILDRYIPDKKGNPYKDHYKVLVGESSWVYQKLISLVKETSYDTKKTSTNQRKATERARNLSAETANADLYRSLVSDESAKSEVEPGVWLTEKQKEFLGTNYSKLYKKLSALKNSGEDWKEGWSGKSDFELLNLEIFFELYLRRF